MTWLWIGTHRALIVECSGFSRKAERRIDMKELDLEGRILTRHEIDEMSYALNDKVRISCDAWGFIKLVDFYNGWLNVPEEMGQGISTYGVHPVVMKKMVVFCEEGNKKGELRFLDFDGNTIAKITNYNCCA